MKKAILRLLRSSTGAIDIVSTVIDVALVVALLPVIKIFIADAQNLTTTETLLLTLVTLFIVIALVASIIKKSGLRKGS